MIDPLGPDPADPAFPAKKTGEIVSDFEVPGSAARLRPRIRHANYDSPEALVRPEPQTLPVTSPSEPSKVLPPIEPAKAIEKPMSATNPNPLTESASTALARPMPPKPGKLERAIGVARTVLPIVGNLLPLLEGNVVSAASNLLANRQVKEIDLKPLEEAIARLQSDQRALAFHTTEQKSAVRRLEDEFVTLQETVQKHAAEQAELAEQVVKLARRFSGFMRLITILLIALILFTTLLVFRIAYILRF